MRNRPEGPPLILIMVGLPARGKTFIARKLARYLAWHGTPARVFNVGNYRRDRLGAHQDHSFFDPTNPEGLAARRAMAQAALSDLISWVTEGSVAIFDATNVTRARRTWVAEALEAADLRHIFVETVCTDASIVESNIRQTKLSSPDYRDRDPEPAMADFRNRIAHYEASYEPLDDTLPYIRLVDAGTRIVVNEVRGYLASRLIPLLMNLHITPRPLYFSRHGQSLFNIDDRIGGDPGLSPAGEEYSRRLAEWIPDRLPAGVRLFTSSLRRTQQTAQYLPYRPVPLRALDEIDAGIYDGLTYDDIARDYPDEFAARKADKLRYRYPRGESYADLIERVDPVMIELERQRNPVVVIAHQAILRCVLAYFTGKSELEMPHLEVPLHTVIKLTPHAYGATVDTTFLGPEA